jgi:SAM-dependent methyltransferase
LARAKAIYLAKALARRLLWAPSDLVSRIRGARTPPRGLSFVGHGDFESVGAEYASFFKELGGLRPEDRVLDMGCGIGRMALPLTEYLDTGSYAGFDVGKAMVRWCRRHITPRHPEFEFTWVPVYNGKYNPFGTISAAEFRFPYDDDSFDFAFATSLFTHLLRDDALHYLGEASRVLKPGGACLLTFFLLTPRAEREVEAGRAMPFVHTLEEGVAIVDRREPELSVAYRVEDLREMLAEVGLVVEEPIHEGLWANAEGGRTLQDIVVARRPG